MQTFHEYRSLSATRRITTPVAPLRPGDLWYGGSPRSFTPPARRGTAPCPGGCGRQIVLDRRGDRASFDPAQLILRSATSAEVRLPLSRALEREFVEPLARELGGATGRPRAIAVLGVLAGVYMIDNVLGIELLHEPQGRRLLEALVRACLDGGD
ncbi:hypothetical protein BE17_13325 [Sorangium cellulosum]|uniref:Tetracyclin repressor-like C-terminal domain-containing protein n=1 Tax=Sorangium cellulosum TaxID=56 RepID=A0A150S9R5_SORCE|nr:hypothetical protein BE17_13325 [Sorangium cellulosum]